MNSPIKASNIHTIEVVAAFILAGFLVYLFRDPINTVLLTLVQDQGVVAALRDVIMLTLGAAGTWLLKYSRSNPRIPVDDYVNGGDKE